MGSQLRYSYLGMKFTSKVAQVLWVYQELLLLDFHMLQAEIIRKYIEKIEDLDHKCAFVAMEYVDLWRFYTDITPS